MSKKNVFQSSIKTFVLMMLMGLATVNLQGQVTLSKLKDKVKEKTSKSGNDGSSSGSNSSSSGKVKNKDWYKVDAATSVFCNDYGFGDVKTAFETGENIFVRFAFPKSVTDVFNEKFSNYSRSTGKYSIAIAKNIDDENPIIITTGDFSLSNYKRCNIMDFTISADSKTFDSFVNHTGDVDSKLNTNSVTTLTNMGITYEWEKLAKTWGKEQKNWEIFLVFSPWDTQLDDRKPELAAQGKFSYTYNASNGNKKAASAMKIGRPVADDGMTSDMHKKYVKQIVFSKTDIGRTGAAEASLSNTFNLGDDIYARSYMEKSGKNEKIGIGCADGSCATGNGKDFFLRIYIDEKVMATMPGNKKYDGAYDYVSPLDGDVNYISTTSFETALSRSWGLPSDKSSDYNAILLDFFYNTWQLPAGAHKVKLEYVFDIPEDGALAEYAYTSAFGDEKILASGEFTLNVTETGKTTTGKKLCSMKDISGYTKFYSGTSKLVPDATNLVKNQLDENTTFIKVVDYSTEWTYNKNTWGVILNRTAYGYAFLQDNATKLYYVQEVLYTEDNTSSGGSTYGKAYCQFQNYDNAGKRICKECLGK